MPDYGKLNRALMESCRAENERFQSAIGNVTKAQESKLIQIVNHNAGTNFGKNHRFDKIRTIDDFRSTVPITTYEGYENCITQIAEGRENVLTRDKVLMLEPTSGSTSPSKFIPYTDSLKREFQAGIFPWLFDLYSNRPELLKGSFYWSITPVTHKQERTSGGVPIGFGDDGVYFNPDQQGLIAQLSAVPFDVAQVQDMGEFKERTLSHLAKNKDLAFISVWNPTFLSLLLRPVEKPSEMWQNVSLVSSWADGNASNYIPEIQRLFPNAEIQGKGLIATEGFISLPLTGYEGSALSINSHFFEFRDLNDNDDVRLAHEVEEGREYETVLTTGGGLYRYNLQDMVKVVGFKNQCPLIRFTGRNNNISDLFGEKLNERHVVGAINQTFGDYSISPSFVMLAPERLNSGDTAYTVFVETQDQFDAEKVASDLDSRLQENYHYKYCRRLGQLEEPRVFSIESDNGKKASDTYLEVGQVRGKKIGNVKPTALSSKLGWVKKFNGRFIN